MKSIGALDYIFPEYISI